MVEAVESWRTWVADAVGPHAVVRGLRRLHGGITSVVHAVDVDDRSGTRHRLVLRRYPPGGPIWAEPWLVTAEVAALGQLAAAGLDGVPRVVAADETGDRAGQPAVLSTRLPGRPILAPVEAMAWAEDIAEVALAHLERMRLLDGAGLGPYPPWRPLAATGPARLGGATGMGPRPRRLAHGDGVRGRRRPAEPLARATHPP